MSAEWGGPISAVAAFLIGAGAIWLAPWPPMIDLPQFAGEIVLLKGLITGTTPWASSLRIDPLTPYLIGYTLALPLAFFLPVAIALKVVITSALAAFGLMAAAVRRELGASRALDAFAMIGFFGFDYSWGLVTFLIAAPLGLLVIWLSLRYLKVPGLPRAWPLALAGTALAFAHALVLLFAVGVGLLLVLARVRAWGVRTAALRAWPFILPLAASVLLFVRSQHSSGGGAGTNVGLTFGPLILRLLGPLAAVDDRPEIWTLGAIAAIAALPFLGGLTLQLRPVDRVIIVGAVFGALALGPDWAWLASGIYRRFALFAPAAWAWMFSDIESRRKGLATAIRPRLALAASVLTGLIFAQHVIEAHQFARETKDFEAVLAQAPPGERAFGLVLDESSTADVDLHVYRHFPLWYEAEKGGLVDPSFAEGPPSIVRYRVNPPNFTTDSMDGADRIEGQRDQPNPWTFFFIRTSSPSPAILFSRLACPPTQVAAQGAWMLFEKRPCVSGANSRPNPPIEN